MILEQLLDQVEWRADCRDFCTTLAKLALARTHLEKAVLIELMADLPEPERALIETCLLDWRDGRAGLHPLVRDEVLWRHRCLAAIRTTSHGGCREAAGWPYMIASRSSTSPKEILSSATRWNPYTTSCWDRFHLLDSDAV